METQQILRTDRQSMFKFERILPDQALAPDRRGFPDRQAVPLSGEAKGLGIGAGQIA
jgi:hypothetical protein